jgi:hypothetical protein
VGVVSAPSSVYGRVGSTYDYWPRSVLSYVKGKNYTQKKLYSEEIILRRNSTQKKFYSEEIILRRNYNSEELNFTGIIPICMY